MPTPKPMMQSVKVLLSLCLLFHFSVSFSQTGEKMQLNLKVQNIKKAVGDIYIAVYDNEDDYMENRFAEAIANVESEGSLEVVLKIPYGKYAVTIFHDVNQDGELSTNFMGIPKEPYGFSNNPKSTFGPPSFEQSLFEFKAPGQWIEIELK
jgi:uncharacterized protein (DUF2141 family)